MNNKTIAVIFGCNSLEHNVSLMTGYNIGKALYGMNIILIGITRDGTWKYSNNVDQIICNYNNINTIHINEDCNNVYQIGNGMINNIHIDKAFLATHGKIGEDGNLQGFLKVNNISYTGNDVNGSVVCFSKDICKYVAELHDIMVVPYFCLNKNDKSINILEKLNNINSNKYVVKINKGGSSIGIFYSNHDNIINTINEAFMLDDSIIIEQDMNVFRELSIGIIQIDNKLIYSDIGEFMKESNHFTFENKYIIHSTGIIPDLPNDIKNKIINNATTLYKKLHLKSYVRIDFFLTPDNKVYFNEINNLPGLSPSGTFVKMWKSKYNYIEFINLILGL